VLEPGAHEYGDVQLEDGAIAPGVPPYATFCQEFLETCTDGAYATATWNVYMTVVNNPLGRHPALRTPSVNPPEEPLFMGGCTPDGGCKANLDFLDVKFDAYGNPWGAFVNDCALTAEPVRRRSCTTPGTDVARMGPEKGCCSSCEPPAGAARG